MTDELPIYAADIAAEARKQAARHHRTPAHNEAIERRISDEVTADALARKRERDARNQTK